jgi:ABC-2 type transport system ATP-binding protein
MSSEPVIRVQALRKSYGTTVAVDGVSFDVQRGEIFGLIGPNGAGKTTTMECVEGLRAADSGSIAVLGLDPVRDVRALQERIGVQLQEAQLQKRITVREAIGLRATWARWRCWRVCVPRWWRSRRGTSAGSEDQRVMAAPAASGSERESRPRAVRPATRR